MSGDGASLFPGSAWMDNALGGGHALAIFRGSTCVQCIPLMAMDAKGSTLTPFLQLEKGRPKYPIHTMRLKQGLRVVGALELACGG